MKKTIVFFTGAGISEESGIPTYRDKSGLWEKFDPDVVASVFGWNKYPEKVIEFYNYVWNEVKNIQPNIAHHIIKEFENNYDVYIITQNVDDLHEKAQSTNILHLHGEINKIRSSINPNLIYPKTDKSLEIGDLCELNSQLRPHLVLFGEEVPLMQEAISLVSKADIFCIVGTSLQVYPANTLINHIKNDCSLYILDPNIDQELFKDINSNLINMKASEGMQELKTILL